MLKNLLQISIIIIFLGSVVSALSVAGLQTNSHESGIELSFDVPEISLQDISTEYGDFMRLYSTNAQFTCAAGEPEMPVYVFLVGLPPSGDVSLEYEIGYEELRKISKPIFPADSAFYENEVIHKIPMAPKRDIYDAKGTFPEKTVRIEDMGFIRSQRVGKITFFPVRYEPHNGTLRITSHIEVKLRFRAGGNYVNEGDFEKVFRNMLLNYNIARSMRIISPIAIGMPENPFVPAETWYRAAIQNGGVYAITREWLQDAGIDPDNVAPTEIRAFSYGAGMLSLTLNDSLPTLKEIDIISIGDDDFEFENCDTLFIYSPGAEWWTAFWGQPSWHASLYSDSISVWIAVRGDFLSVAHRAENIPAVTSSHQRNFGWTFQRIGEDSEFDEYDEYHWNNWYWQLAYRWLAISLTDPRISTTHLPNGHVRQNASGSCASIDCNGTIHSGSSSWISELIPSANIITYNYNDSVLFRYGEIRYLIEISPNDGEVHFFTDTLSPMPSTEEPVRFNMPEFEHPIAVDVSDFPSLRRLETGSDGGTYYFTDTESQREYFVFERDEVQLLPQPQVLTNLTLWEEPASQSDYLILSPREFNISELAELQENRGLSTVAYRVEDIMTQFGFGRYDPTAIRNFICYLYCKSDAPKPQYAVFVGDGHYDYRHILTSTKEYFPPAMEAGHECDAFFSTFKVDDLSGTDSRISRTMEIMTGRLPVRSQSELNDIVGKTEKYSGCAPFGEWRIRSVLAADDELTDTGTDGFTHTNQNSAIIENELPTQILPDPVYLIDYALTSTRRKPTSTDALMSKINRGALWVNWIGHGNYHLWAHEYMLNFPGDMSRWNCGDKIPIVSAFSCYVGKFWRLGGRECIAEILLRESDNGSVGVIAATSGSNPSLNHNINKGLIHNLFGDYAVPIAGALVASRAALYPNHDSQYLLMGDPAMESAYPYSDINIEIEPDTILPGSWLVVSGRTDESINGEILLFLQEPLVTKYYYSSYIDSDCYYKSPGKILFAGAASVNDGSFELSMFVPQHLASDSGFKIIGYAYAEENCYNASGALIDIPANRSVSSDVNDTIGPVIEFHFDMDDFQNGGMVCSHDGSLYVAIELSDEHGIDMGSTPGHGILLQLDDEFHQVDVSQNLSYAIDDPTSAQTHYIFSDVFYGGHTICVQAWDNLGNPSQACIDIELEDCSANIYDILPYPNPFSDGVDITFSLAGTGATADVTLQIFSIGGRKIFSKSKTTSAQFDWVHWDGCAPNGESVARGVYIYVIQATLNAGDGQKTQRTERGKIVKR